MVGQMREKIKEQKGFTLIELLVVIAIIAILAAIAIPQYMKYKKKAAETAAAQMLSQAASRLAAEYTDNGTKNATVQIGKTTVYLYTDGNVICANTSQITDNCSSESGDNVSINNINFKGYNITCYYSNDNETFVVKSCQ